MAARRADKHVFWFDDGKRPNVADALENGDGLGNVEDDVHIMLDQDHGQPGSKFFDQPGHLLRFGGRQPARRFVEKDQLRR